LVVFFKNNREITQDQIKILQNCKAENTASELRKISKRTNKSKFKENVLDPLILAILQNFDLVLGDFSVIFT
jgi:hypothetical protein